MRVAFAVPLMGPSRKLLNSDSGVVECCGTPAESAYETAELSPAIFSFACDLQVESLREIAMLFWVAMAKSSEEMLLKSSSFLAKD